MASTYVDETAAVSFVDTLQQIHLHVYSCDGNNVTERVWDGNGWTNGSLTQPGEKVSATAWYIGSQYFIRVYCTNAGMTTEWCTDGGGAWYQGAYTES